MKSLSNVFFILGAILALLLFAVAVSADIITLKTGEVVIGVVEEETARGAIVRTNKGASTIPRSDIENVEYEDAATNTALLGQSAPLTEDAAIPSSAPTLHTAAVQDAPPVDRVWYEGELLSIDAIVKRLTDATAARNAAERRLVDQAEEITRLENTVTARGARIARLEREAKQQQSTLDAAYKDVRDWEQSRDALRSELYERDAEIESLRRDAGHLERQLHDTEHALRAAEKRLYRTRNHWGHSHYHDAHCEY